MIAHEFMPPYNHTKRIDTIVRLHRIGVFLPLRLPVTTVGSYVVSFITRVSRIKRACARRSGLWPREAGPLFSPIASFTLKTFRVFVVMIGSIVSVILSRSPREKIFSLYARLWRPLAAIAFVRLLYRAMVFGLS